MNNDLFYAIPKVMLLFSASVPPPLSGPRPREFLFFRYHPTPLPTPNSSHGSSFSLASLLYPQKGPVQYPTPSSVGFSVKWSLKPLALSLSHQTLTVLE